MAVIKEILLVLYYWLNKALFFFDKNIKVYRCKTCNDVETSYLSGISGKVASSGSCCDCYFGGPKWRAAHPTRQANYDSLKKYYGDF